MFLDGALCPYPDSLAAQLGVDAPDGAFRFWHGGHHRVGLGGGDVAVLVDGQPVYKAQVVVEREFAEKVATHLDVGIVRFEEPVTGSRRKGVVQVDNRARWHVHGFKDLHALACVAHAALAYEGALDEREGLPGNALEEGGQHAPFGLAFGQQNVVGKEELVAVR